MVKSSSEYVAGDILLAILLHDDIIDWRYIAWRYNAGDILLAIFLPYTILYILSYTCIHVPLTILASIASVQNYANYFGQC